MAKNVLVLGSTGMLGSAVFEELKKANLDPIPASRSSGINFDATTLEVAQLLDTAGLESGDFVVNCVGLTKSRIDETTFSSRAMAVKLNIEFPQALIKLAEDRGLRVIQVATDCVFSGEVGGYAESSKHDPLDVYGKTKSLGEFPSESAMHLRCSLIGPEVGRSSLFFEWLRQLSPNSEISGFTNHMWNGLSSDTFGRIVAGIVSNDYFMSGVQHLVPADILSKDELVRFVLEALGREDISVYSTRVVQSVDRTLQTERPKQNSKLFEFAGYAKPPTISEMVVRTCSELANLSQAGEI